jgi:hypothetical protein
MPGTGAPSATSQGPETIVTGGDMHRRRGSRGASALLGVGALALSACGGAPSPSIDPGGGDEVAVAPSCSDVPELEAQAPEAQAPEEERSLGSELQRWGEREATDSFAGVWVDQRLGGFAVAFAEEVDAYAEEVRERFHPGIAVAEAATTYAELRETQARLDEELAAGAERWDEAPEAPEAGDESQTVSGPEPNDLMWSGVQVMINRVTVGLYEPDAQRLADLSERYGAEVICFEVTRMPEEAEAEPAPFVPADDADLSPESTSIELLVNERGCASGQSAEDRMAPAEIEYGEDAVVVTTRVVPPPGPQTCPSNPDTPVTVELEEPLGDRELLDGSRQPAAEPKRDW